jgi:hypothetical protein
VPSDGRQWRRTGPRDVVMDTLSLFDWPRDQPLVFVQDQATLGGSSRKPVE